MNWLAKFAAFWSYQSLILKKAQWIFTILDMYEEYLNPTKISNSFLGWLAVKGLGKTIANKDSYIWLLIKIKKFEKNFRWHRTVKNGSSTIE